MKTTKQQDIIISRMTDYVTKQLEWNELTKDMNKPVWVGEGASEKIRSNYEYLEKYEYTVNAVLEALNVSFEDAEKLYNEYEAYCNSL